MISSKSGAEVGAVKVPERYGAIGGGGLGSARRDDEAVRGISEDVAEYGGFVGHHRDLAGDWADTAFDDLRDRARGTATTLDAMTKRVELTALRINTIEARLATTAMPPLI